MESSNSTQQQQQVKKKTIYVRKKLEEHLTNAKNLASHPSLPNVKILNAPAPQGGQKGFQKAVRRMSVQMMKLSEQFSRDSLNSAKSGESVQVGNGQKGALMQSSGLQQISEEKVDQENRYVAEVEGPQLKLSRTHISFVELRGKVAYDWIEVQNNGTASIYHEWVPIGKERRFSWSLEETEQKFYCHHEKNVIKPGEKKKFIFAFLSSLTGIFTEDWQLICEPPCTIAISKLNLSGQAIEIDEKKEWRSSNERQLHRLHLYKNMGEIVEDVLFRVKTPTPELPDLNDPLVAEREFEEKNREYKVWYNPLVIKWWRNLERQLYRELRLDESKQYWDLSLSYLKNMIDKISDYEEREIYEQYFENYLELCKKRPIERSPVFSYVREKLVGLIENIPVYAEQSRRELEMWDGGSFVLPPYSEDYLKSKEEEMSKIKAEWLKKAKKKKWTEDDERQLIQSYEKSVSEKFRGQLGQDLESLEERREYIECAERLRKLDHPPVGYFNNLQRIQTLQTQDIDGKRVLVRSHLRLSSSANSVSLQQEFETSLLKAKEEEEKRLELERQEAEKALKDKKKGGASKRPVANKKGKEVEPEKKEEDLFKQLRLDFLDQENLSDILNTLKYLQSKNAKVIFLCLSYGEKTAQYSYLKSMEFFANWLRKNYENFQVYFEKNLLIPNFEEKMETEIYPDGSIVILENAYFYPQEIGFENKLVKNPTDDTQFISHCKLMHEERTEFIKLLSEYGNIFVLEDKSSIFVDKLATVLNLKSDSKVLGLKIGSEVQTVAHVLTFKKSPFLTILGGPMTFDKLLAFYSLLFYADTIFLTGEFGVHYYLYQNKDKNQLGHIKKNTQFTQILDLIFQQIQSEQKQYDQLLKLRKTPNFSRPSLPLIIYPEDFLFLKQTSDEQPITLNWSPKKLEPTTSNDDYREVDVPEPDTFELVDLGDKTLSNLFAYLQESLKILIIDTPDLAPTQHHNISTTHLAKYLHQSNLIKRQRITDHKGNIEYDYHQDTLVVLAGSQLLKNIETIQILDKKPKKLSKHPDDQLSQISGHDNDDPNDDQEHQSDNGDQKSQVSSSLGAPGGTSTQSPDQQPKNKNLELVADLTIQDSLFATKIISGQFIRPLHNLDIYKQKKLEESEIAIKFIDSLFEGGSKDYESFKQQLI